MAWVVIKKKKKDIQILTLNLYKWWWWGFFHHCNSFPKKWFERIYWITVLMLKYLNIAIVIDINILKWI